MATASPPAALISSTTAWAAVRAAAGAVDRAAEVVHDDQRAAPGQLERVGAAEAAARAGDDRDLAVESEISHGVRIASAEAGAEHGGQADRSTAGVPEKRASTSSAPRAATLGPSNTAM